MNARIKRTYIPIKHEDYWVSIMAFIGNEEIKKIYKLVTKYS